VCTFFQPALRKNLSGRRIWARGIMSASFLLAGLSACSGGQPGIATATLKPAASPTLAPSATPVPFIILYAPESPKTSMERQAREAISAFATDQGWQTQTLAPSAQVAAEALARQPKLVAGVGSGMGRAIQTAAQENPNLRFLLVEEEEGGPLPNLLVIGGANIRRDEVGFMAGLLAGIINSNHRAGWLGAADTVNDKLYRNGYLHGVHYFCPLCLLYAYDLAPDASAADGEALASQLLGDYISTASSIPGKAGDAALVTLAARGVDVAGTRADMYQELFLGGSVSGADHVLGEPVFRADVMVKAALARWFQGEKYSDPIPFSVENGGLEYAPFWSGAISRGKENLLREIMDRIRNGSLGVGVNLTTGDPD
jgi:basic membrane lipoprotein Med (substrate-binding protein (PBP1-ABC) superfamily)